MLSVIINKITWFSRLNLYFDLYASLMFSVLYGTNKILREIDLLFNSNFFQPLRSDGKSISFQLYWLINGLIFNNFCGSFLTFWQFNGMVKVYWKQLLSLFIRFIVDFLFFSHLGESNMMITFCSDFFFAGYNIINQHYQK